MLIFYPIFLHGRSRPFLATPATDFFTMAQTKRLMMLILLQMMSAIKSGTISHSRFAQMAERDYKVSC